MLAVVREAARIRTAYGSSSVSRRAARAAAIHGACRLSVRAIVSAVATRKPRSSTRSRVCSVANGRRTTRVPSAARRSSTPSPKGVAPADAAALLVVLAAVLVAALAAALGLAEELARVVVGLVVVDVPREALVDLHLDGPPVEHREVQRAHGLERRGAREEDDEGEARRRARRLVQADDDALDGAAAREDGAQLRVRRREAQVADVDGARLERRARARLGPAQRRVGEVVGLRRAAAVLHVLREALYDGGHRAEKQWSGRRRTASAT